MQYGAILEFAGPKQYQHPGIGNLSRGQLCSEVSECRGGCQEAPTPAVDLWREMQTYVHVTRTVAGPRPPHFGFLFHILADFPTMALHRSLKFAPQLLRRSVRMLSAESERLIALEDRHGAHNYAPLPGKFRKTVAFSAFRWCPWSHVT